MLKFLLVVLVCDRAVILVPRLLSRSETPASGTLLLISLCLRRKAPKSASRTTVANGSFSIFIRRIRRQVERGKPTIPGGSTEVRRAQRSRVRSECRQRGFPQKVLHKRRFELQTAR